MTVAASKAAYAKPWLSYPEQVALLASRGLVVNDQQAAERFLRHLNYYRFSGYCLAFESPRHVFIPGTNFEQIVATYEFDLALRDLMTEALEVIEVDFRSAIAYDFGRKHGPFGHTDSSKFFRQFKHTEWLAQLHEESTRSSEPFVQHCQTNYREFPDLPIWIVTEVMSFGWLSKMFSGMDREDQKTVAKRFSLQPDTLESWMHHCAHVRNVCAHHCRLWDRTWTIKAELPKFGTWLPPHVPDNKHLFATLLILRRLLTSMPAVKTFSDSWKKRIETHVSSPPPVPAPHQKMGLTDNWTKHSVWR